MCVSYNFHRLFVFYQQDLYASAFLKVDSKIILIEKPTTFMETNVNVWSFLGNKH